MLSAMEYRDWLMVAGAVLLMVGFIGFVFRLTPPAHLVARSDILAIQLQPPSCIANFQQDGAFPQAKNDPHIGARGLQAGA